MATVESMFGTYASRLQVMIDNALSQFDPLWFPQYFDWEVPKTSLTFETLISRTRIGAAASVIARGSRAPLRSRVPLSKITGTIPAIAVKYKMDEGDYREYLSLQGMQVDEATKKAAILDYMWNDVKLVGNGAMKRLEIFCAEAVSTGLVTINLTNNPDGTVNPEPLDLGMPEANQTNAAGTWVTANTATPIADIIKVVNDQMPNGRRFSKILMTWTTWNRMIATTEVKDMYAAFVGKTNNKLRPTLENVNQFLSGQQLPTIELVDIQVGIEKDGVVSVYKPWKEENIAFVPDGRLGVIHNALALEQIRPVEKVSYATFNRALISKWADNEPFQEFTKSELNAFPGLTAIDNIHLLSTTAAFV
jgi:hypothetical protein